MGIDLSPSKRCERISEREDEKSLFKIGKAFKCVITSLPQGLCMYSLAAPGSVDEGFPPSASLAEPSGQTIGWGGGT